MRLARPDLKFFFEGALNWYGQMIEKGVPLPKLYFSSLDTDAYAFPVMIMDRLPGKDLGEVYPTLTTAQKHAIANRIAAIQRSVATLPLGDGYGYARSERDPRLQSQWIDVLDSNVEQSRERIHISGVIDLKIVDRIKALLHQHEAYFSTVKPTCFLDDTTTKNVVIHNGALSGIVDVDSVAYGDPLLTLGLTRTALLALGYDTEYTDYWAEKLNLNSDQQKALTLYTAMFCVNFLSEKGHAFNKAQADPVERKAVDGLTYIFHKMTADL